MALNTPQASVGTGLATGGIAYMIYSMNMPPVTDVRAAEPENGDVDAAERTSTWIAAAFVTGVALITGDATVFVIGGAMVVVLSWLYRHANEVSPLTGKAFNGISVPGMTSDRAPDADVLYMDENVMAG